MKAVSIGSNRRFAMFAKKPLALGILVWAASLSVVQADPINFPNNFNWVAYFAGQNGNGGGNPVAASSMPAAMQPVAASTTPAATQPVAAPMVAVPTPTAQSTAVTPVSLIANAPVAQPQSTPTTVSAPTTLSGPVDAFINLGTGPYPLAGSITTGNAQPWYESSQITSLFGGQPTAQQIQSFDSTILQRVEQTFSLSGVSVTLTDNPNVVRLAHAQPGVEHAKRITEQCDRHDSSGRQRLQLHR